MKTEGYTPHLKNSTTQTEMSTKVETQEVEKTESLEGSQAEDVKKIATIKDAMTLEDEENKLIEISEEEQNAEEEQKDDGIIQKGKDFLGQMTRITKKTFTESKGAGDYIETSNHIAGTVMSQGFNPDQLEDILDTNKEVKDSIANGPQVLESSLSPEEQKEAREYAIKLLEEQLNENMANMPDYGHVRQYYNEGSIMDWILSHPVSFAANWAAEKTGAKWYTNFVEKGVGKDGMFTAFNIPSYMKGEREDGLREGHWLDVFGNIQTEEDLKNYVAKKQELIAELKANVDNPEKFAETFYYATEGVNFSADNVMEYKNTIESEEKNGVNKEDQTKPSVGLIGRNFLAEDIKKNEMMTNITYDVNKTIGTMLCNMIPVVGPLVAGAVNVGVTVLEEKTQNDNELTKGEWTKIILTEGIGRNLAVNGIGKIVGKIFGNGSSIWKTALGSTMQSSIDTSIDATGNIIDGNTGGLIGDAVESGTGWKAALKTGGKVAVKQVGKGILNGIKSLGKSITKGIFKK